MGESGAQGHLKKKEINRRIRGTPGNYNTDGKLQNSHQNRKEKHSQDNRQYLQQSRHLVTSGIIVLFGECEGGIGIFFKSSLIAEGFILEKKPTDEIIRYMG